MRSIAHVSDLHFGRHKTEIAEDLLASLNSSGADLIALSGDFTQRAKHAEFAEAQRFLQRISQPKLVIPGNHDVPLYNVWARFMHPFAKFNRYVAPAGVPACMFHDDEIAVLGLNTARRFTGKNGRVSLAQIAAINHAFSAVPRGACKVLVTHHPLGFPLGDPRWQVAGRARLAMQAIAASGVRLLLAGHYHRTSSGELEDEEACKHSVLTLHAGTAISTRTRGMEANSYNLVHVRAGNVTVDAMEWRAGQGFIRARSTSFALHEGRWRQQA